MVDGVRLSILPQLGRLDHSHGVELVDEVGQLDGLVLLLLLAHSLEGTRPRAVVGATRDRIDPAKKTKPAVILGKVIGKRIENNSPYLTFSIVTNLSLLTMIHLV